jgi:membrane-associated PAP2 superfamily phosphatase
MSGYKIILIHLGLLLGIICLFEFTDLDLIFQDHFYIWEKHRWLVDRHALIPRLIFYTGVKVVIIAFWSLCFMGWVFSFRIKKLFGYRYFCMLMSLSLGVVPLTVSVLKDVSNVYTPSQIRRYGGNKPYIKLFEKNNQDNSTSKKSKGKGWPAGHASGGFSLMALYYASSKRRYRTLGLFTGMAVGWTMGLYQMLKGAHFLSHTLVTMSIAWIWISFINSLASDQGLHTFAHSLSRIALLDFKKILKNKLGAETKMTFKTDHMGL